MAKLSHALSEASKLVIDQFVTEKGSRRNQETQKMLDSLLLEIVVAQLDQQCQSVQQNQMMRPSKQEPLSQLLQLLSRVIKVSEGSFLVDGNDKVARCTQLLIFLLHNIEIPVIVRQTIMCAKKLFKVVDF